jgi:hypothetical protein
MATPETQNADTFNRIFIGRSEQPTGLMLGFTDHHDLVTGAGVHFPKFVLNLEPRTLQKRVRRLQRV